METSVELMNKLKETLSPFNYERFIKIYSDETPEEEKKELLKRFLCNRLVRIKFSCREYRKDINNYVSIKKDYKSYLSLQKKADIKNQELINELRKTIAILDSVIDNRHSLLADKGKLINEILCWYNALATNSEFASLININAKIIEQRWQDYKAKNKDSYNFFVALIVSYKVEPDDNCPFFDAIFEFLMQEREKNPALKKDMDEKMNELYGFDRVPKYYLQCDEDGDIISVQEEYPPLIAVK